MSGSFLQRIWQYQKERFPIVAHGLLIAAFTFSAIAYSHICRHDDTPIYWLSFLKAFVNTFSLFLLLRISDEFKDAEYDKRNRSHLPVPRGLVSLKELKKIGIGLLISLTLFDLFFASQHLWIYAIILVYLFLMYHEFFCKHWLEKHQLAYVVSHMMIIPIVDTMASSFDWMNSGPDVNGLYWFFAVSFFNGCTLELGRKIKATENEESNSYSLSLGFKKSLLYFQLVLGVTYVLCLGAAWYAELNIYHHLVFTFMYIITAVYGFYFYTKRSVKNSKLFEILSGLWAIGMYLNLGIGIFFNK